MDFDRLERVVRWLAQSPLRELEVRDDAVTIRVRKREGRSPVSEAGARPEPGFEPISQLDEQLVADEGLVVRSPLYGVCHLAPKAADPPFVTVGQGVSAGQTLCLIEAMKVFSPVQAETDGTVTEILVAAGAEVTANQPLFRIERL